MLGEQCDCARDDQISPSLNQIFAIPAQLIIPNQLSDLVQLLAMGITDIHEAAAVSIDDAPQVHAHAVKASDLVLEIVLTDMNDLAADLDDWISLVLWM